MAEGSLGSPRVEELTGWVRSQVSPKRFRHIQGVVRTARAIAEREGLSEKAAETAAWLHDCAKEWSKEAMLRSLRGTPFRLDPLERRLPALWHPHAGAAAALKRWGIQNPDILEAIRCHTLGGPGMGPLAQVLFIADFVEPSREFPGLVRARREARKGLREGVLAKASQTLVHLLEGDQVAHPRLLETWNSFREDREP